MKVKELTCKTALSPSKLPGLDYALNPYSGCGHQCTYCYVPTVLHLPRQTWGETIYVKRNLPRVLAKELLKKKPGVVGISTVTDPYQPVEQTYHITRYCLQQLKKYDFPVQIQTKSTLVLNDLLLIEDCFKPEIMISIGTINDSQRKILEPCASSIADRLRILDALKNNEKIKTSVFLGPLYPDLSWNQIKSLLNMFIEKKVSTIMIDKFHLKSGLQTYLLPVINNDEILRDAFSAHVFTQSDWYEKKVNQIIQYIYSKSDAIRIKKAF